MEHNPPTVSAEKSAHSEKEVQAVKQVHKQNSEHQQTKTHENSQTHKNETVQKVIEPQHNEQGEEQAIRKFVFSFNPHITQEQIIQYIHFQLPQKRPLVKEHFEEWQRSLHNQKEKVQDTSNSKQEVSHPIVKKQQAPKKVLTSIQICQQFFTTYKQTEHGDIKSKTIALLNTVVPSMLPISANHVVSYFKTEQSSHSLAHFKEWIMTAQQHEVEQYLKHFQSTKGFSELQKSFAKIEEILSKVNQKKQQLQINLGFGQNKGKTGLKFGVGLSNKKDNNFEITLDVKIKKKLQLKALLEGQIKRWQKVQGFHLFKLCRLEITQGQKGLKISIHSQAFQKHILKHIIKSIESKCEQQQKPNLRVQGEITIKNSIRNDEATLQKKRFIKWLCEGFTSHLSIEGSTALIQYFTSPLAEYFPIFKVIRSGEINLKTKNIASIDKLFDKLGINEISEETPTLPAFAAELIKEQLASQTLPWVPELMKKCIHFASTIPNERISIDVSGSLSYLSLQVSFSAQACKELGEIVLSTTNEIFS